MPNYECMILVDPTAAAREWDEVTGEIEAVFKKHGGKTLSINKWGERRLAYPIGKVTRGTYVLAYFEGDADVPKKVKAEFVLSERVMRTLIRLHEGPIEPKEMPPEEPRRSGYAAEHVRRREQRCLPHRHVVLISWPVPG